MAEIVHRGREVPVNNIIFSPPPEARSRLRDPYAHLHHKRASRQEKARKRRILLEEGSPEGVPKQAGGSPINERSVDEYYSKQQ